MARADTAGDAVFRYVLTTFEIGNQTIPPVAIPVRRGGGVDTLTLLAVAHHGGEPAAGRLGGGRLRPVAPAAAPMTLNGRFRWGVLFLYLAVTTALVLAGLWLWARRPKKPLLPVFEPARVVRPPDAVALEALDAIAAQAYAERGLYKPHYTEVMDVLRAYVEGRYELEVLDRTTPELLAAMREKGIERALCGRLGGLLEEADLVKFARWTPDVDSARALLDAARNWVRESTAAARAMAAARGIVAVPAAAPAAAPEPGAAGPMAATEPGGAGSASPGAEPTGGA